MSDRCRVLLVFLVFVLGMILNAPQALARDTDNSWEFGGFFLLTHFASASNLDDGFGFGVRGGYHFKAIHELEGTLDWVSADNAKQPDISNDVTKLAVDYMRMFLLKGHEKVTPFASFGVGLTHIDNGTDSDSITAYRGGGGFKYFFKPRAGLRFDVKFYRSNGDGTIIPSDPFFSLDVMLGATFLVGGSK